MPDGQHFLLIELELAGGDGNLPVHVVLNWFEELRRLVPTN
jgi:hypothetical protein